MIEKIPKHKIKSKSITKDKVELSFEISDKKILYVNEDTAKALGFDIKNPAFAGATIVKTKN